MGSIPGCPRGAPLQPGRKKYGGTVKTDYERRDERRWKKVGGIVVFLGCLATLVVNQAATLHFSHGATTALVIGVILSGMDLL